MKRMILVLAITVLFAGAAFGQTSIAGVLPKDARSMGMGGAFRVFSTGYNTFFGNPAGFASKTGSLTIADIAAWAYFKPTQENIDRAMRLINDEASTSEMVGYIDDFITKNGLGAGASAGLGWAGKGFGLGFTLVTDNVASGNSLLGSKLLSETQANVTAGLAIPLNLGAFTFKLGADARAFYRLNSYPGSGWPFADIVSAMTAPGGDPETALRDLYVVGGYGFALDAGATVGIGPLVLGAMVRDFGLEFKMGQTKVGTIMDTASLPTDGTDPYSLSPVISTGIGLQFNFGKIFAPSLYIETEDPIAVISDGFGTMWNKVHAGAELKLLNFIALRAGLNKGWVSLGAGLDLIIFEVDAALFTEELGNSPGDFGRTGIAVQAAIRL